MEKEFKNMYLLNKVFSVVHLFVDNKIGSFEFYKKKQDYFDEDSVLLSLDVCTKDYDLVFSEKGDYTFEFEILREFYSIVDCKSYVHFSVIKNDSLLSEEYYLCRSNIDIDRMVEEVEDCFDMECEKWR